MPRENGKAQCKMVPKGATKDQRKTAHFFKMKTKEKREENTSFIMPNNFVHMAPVGRKHPDYMLTAKEHFEKKRASAIEDAKNIS